MSRAMFRRLSGLLLSCAFLSAWQPELVAQDRPQRGDQPAVTIAALPFAGAAAGDRYAPLAEAIGDMLLVRMSGAEGLALVERSAIDKVLGEQELTARMGPDDQARLGKLVGARFVLTGSVTAVGEELQISASLLEIGTRRVARSAKVTARPDALVEPVDRLARDLTGGLNLRLPELSPAQIDRSPEANLHFTRGLGYYYAKMPERASAQFMKALAIDPRHARARFHGGINYFDQSEYGHARIELGRFVRQFGTHPLVPRARKVLAQCEARQREAGQGGSP